MHRSNGEESCTRRRASSSTDSNLFLLQPPNCPLVTKSEFEPTSQINPNVNPNQVVGTFLPGAPVVGGQVDPNGLYPINPAIVSQPNTYIGRPYAAAAENQEEIRETYEGRGVAPQVVITIPFVNYDCIIGLATLMRDG